MSREVHLMRPVGLPARAHVIYEPVATDIHDDALRALFQRWQRERVNGRSILADEALSFPEVAALRGNLMLLDVVPGEATRLDYVYRIYGEDIARHYGRDMTGRRTSELPGAVAGFFADLYETAIRRGILIHSLHSPPANVDVTRWERLIFPLGGPKIHSLLVVNIPKGRREARGLAHLQARMGRTGPANGPTAPAAKRA